MELFDRKGLLEATRLSPRKLEVLLYLLRAPKLTRKYNTLTEKQGTAMLEEAFEVLNIILDFDEEALFRAIPDEGPFITVSNHPFGFIDGIIILCIISRKRPDYRVVANFLLSYFAPISDSFITVNPFENAKVQSMGGRKKSLEQITNGNGLGIFPAGEVATWYKGQKGIEDRPWSLRSMELIKTAQAPVIPVYFHGRNSLMFHILGKIHPALRTLMIPTEFIKRWDSTFQIGVGNRIELDELNTHETNESLRDFLRGKVFEHREKYQNT